MIGTANFIINNVRKRKKTQLVPKREHQKCYAVERGNSVPNQLVVRTEIAAAPKQCPVLLVSAFAGMLPMIPCNFVIDIMNRQKIENDRKKFFRPAKNLKVITKISQQNFETKPRSDQFMKRLRISVILPKHNNRAIV
jgi:hypothetical protein